jgi:hypothetical protein
MKLFGWQGITCLIPEEWDLTGVSGSAREGYFSFDDERMRRLEIKYARARRWGRPALEKTLTNYFDTIRKRLKKGTRFDVEEDVRLIDMERLPGEYDWRVYGWTSDLVARGVIWHCRACRRVVIAQCLAAPNRVNLREMSDVLTSMRCHAEGVRQRWAAFDFAVEVPKEMELETHRLQAGLISLGFAHRGGRLVVDRLGMAHAVLKHRPMDRYVREVHYKKLRRRRLRFIAAEWNGHPGFRLEGERFRLTYFLPYIGNKLRQWRTSDHVAGRVWHCESANRLFIIRAEGKNAQQLADDVAASIECHEDSP